MAENDQVKVGDLLIINYFKIKNTEKVFIKHAQTLAKSGVINFLGLKNLLSIFDFEKKKLKNK